MLIVDLDNITAKLKVGQNTQRLSHLRERNGQELLMLKTFLIGNQLYNLNGNGNTSPEKLIKDSGLKKD